ncbi:MAG TPA: hypothetical protein P5238_10050 [Smithellaceae bacterium]|nr:hypothetical protein [Smithellaceae bacterium]HRS83817.1 hypothetical protein [Smithellaceae bacterium]HRV44398.1 hypothetical protein [Smithellaceae bacterium]
MLESATIAVRLSFHELTVTPDHVARYAGGSRYRPDAKRKKLACDAVECSAALVQPAFAYAALPVFAADSEKDAALFFPPEALNAGPVCIIAAVCTIGPDLEKQTADLMAQGKYPEALFLDAAGVACVEALADAAYCRLNREAAKKGLFTSRRFVPGIEAIPGNAQTVLVESVHPEIIGVSLNASGVLSPLKSCSFWVNWTSQPPPEAASDKCQNCTMNHCPYRTGNR